MKKTANILIVGPSWIGDMVLAQSLFMMLKKAEPACRIDVLAPPWTLSLLERMPEIAKTYAMTVPHGRFGLLARLALARQLKGEGYDQAIILPNSWKSALIPFFAAIPVRTGYIGECRWGLLNDARKLDKRKLTMTVQRFAALGLPASSRLPPECPQPSITVERSRQQTAADKFGLSLSTKILALCPGAEYGPAKRWPANYYADVARRKISQGWQVWLFGSAKDKHIAAQINREASGLCNDFTGNTALAEAVDLLSLADYVVTNDSGLMHVAAALDKKIVALYGSSDPGFTPPLADNASVVSLNLECAPCFKRKCPLYPSDHQNYTRCLTEIKPSSILDLIDG